MKTNGEQIGEYIDLGITGLRNQRSLARKQEFVSIIRRVTRDIGDRSGQIIVSDRITDRQKRHAVVFLNKNGLRPRVNIDRNFPYHDGNKLTFGTRIEVLERSLSV